MVDDKQRVTASNGTRTKSSLKEANGQSGVLGTQREIPNKKLSVFNSCRYCQGRWNEARELKRIMNENEKLINENTQLKKEIENLKQSEKMEMELKETKDALHEMKIDMKLIQDEKRDVFMQLGELHQVLDEKEDELRQFMREYESNSREHESEVAGLITDRTQLTQEKDELSHKYEGASEVISSMRLKVAAKDKRIRELELELANTIAFLTPAQVEVRNRRSCNSDDYTTVNQRVNPAMTDGNITAESGDFVSSPTSAKVFLPTGSYLSSNEEVNSVSHPPLEKTTSGKLKKRTKLVSHISGSLSRAWGRTKSRKSLDVSNNSTGTEVVILSTSRLSLCDRTESEKKEILDKSKAVPMHKWKAETVQVWLELVMCMAQYIPEFVENIKSGKVLLGMTEEEFESCLCIHNPLHRRKLLLAIEEFQHPAVTPSTMSCAGQLDHWWVSEHWLTDIGMSQYADKFQENLVDGRVLDSLSRKDLEKLLGIDNKKHQDAIIRGIELLAMLGFDKQRLEDRRQMCHSCDSDLLVWSTARVMHWAKSVDLKEYASNLRESGVHGALLVLESAFSSDDLAVALGIPSSKTILRRHLATEFDALIRPARESFKEENCMYNSISGSKKRSGSLSHTFIRSAGQAGRKSRRSLRSLSRSFGRHLARDYHSVNGTDQESK